MKTIIAWVCVGAALAGAAFLWQNNRSLKAEFANRQGSYQRMLDSVGRVAQARADTSLRLAEERDKIYAEGASARARLGRLRDSLSTARQSGAAPGPTPAESLAYWRTQYIQRNYECVLTEEELKIADRDLTTCARADSANRTVIADLKVSDSLKAKSIKELNESLEKATKRECTYLFVKGKCPSYTTVYLIGALSGIVVGAVIKQ